MFSDDNDFALYTELFAALPYAEFICPELGDTTNLTVEILFQTNFTVLPEMSYLSFMCLLKLSMGQNLLDMFLKLRFQGHTIPGDISAHMPYILKNQAHQNVLPSRLHMTDTKVRAES